MKASSRVALADTLFPITSQSRQFRAKAILMIYSVPPFLYLSLVTQEMHAWLAGSDARVAVLHCKGTCLDLFLPLLE